MKKNIIVKLYFYSFIVLLVLNFLFLNKTLKNRQDRKILKYKTKVNKIIKEIEVGILKKNIDGNKLTAEMDIFMRHLNDEKIIKTDVEKIVNFIRETFQLDIVYLMNAKGDVVSSSTYNEKKNNLLGNNYSFREYFKGSMKGKQIVYAALGVTTYRHGIYISSPIYDTESKVNVRGVLVFKLGLESINILIEALKEPAIFTNPDGMILASTNRKWLFKSKQLLNINGSIKNSNSEFNIINSGKLEFPLFINKWKIEIFPEKSNFALTIEEKIELSFIYLTPIFLMCFIFFLHMQIITKAKLERELEKYYLIVQQSPISILITDPNGKIQYVNPSLEKATGYTLEELLGKKPNIFRTSVYNDEFYDDLWKTIKSKKIWTGEFFNKKKNLENYWESSIIVPLIDNKGDILNFVAIKEDITEKKELEEKLKYQAATDEMTKVFNKRSGLLFLEKQLYLAKRQNNGTLSISYIDINDLKLVNDSYGHKEGDTLIIKILEIIKEQIRNSDIISRFGGDEFLIVFPDCNSSACLNLMKRICKKLNEINAKKILKYPLSISYGISQFNPDEEIDIDKLISIADEKMYKMKQRIKKNRSSLNN